MRGFFVQNFLMNKIKRIKIYVGGGSDVEGFKKYKIDYSGGALYVENIKWNDTGLVVELENEKCEKIKLIFESTVYLYINTSESYKPEFWIENPEDYYPFLYSENSEKICELKKEAPHIENEKINHFAIVGVDNIVEVFTSDFPKVHFK